MKGKSYACRKKSFEKAWNDFYPTPKGLTIELLKTHELDNMKNILECSCGKMAISNVLSEHGFNVTSKDIIYGNNFLVDDYSGEKFDAIVTNPPFSLFDEFVEKAKSIDCKKIIMIGRLNHFGSHKTTINGTWNNLSDIYVFDRQVAYDKPFREDGKFQCGCLITGWFVWNKEYNDAPKLHVIDVNDWVYRNKENK